MCVAGSVQNMGNRARDTGYEVQDTGHGAQGTDGVGYDKQQTERSTCSDLEAGRLCSPYLSPMACLLSVRQRVPAVRVPEHPTLLTLPRFGLVSLAVNWRINRDCLGTEIRNYFKKTRATTGCMGSVALSASRRRASTTVRPCAARTTVLCRIPATLFLLASTATHSYTVCPRLRIPFPPGRGERQPRQRRLAALILCYFLRPLFRSPTIIYSLSVEILWRSN